LWLAEDIAIVVSIFAAAMPYTLTLSTYIRIKVIGFVEVAAATTWTGDVSVEPDNGELTVTPANETAARLMITTNRRKRLFTPPLLKG
jgi:hypothetical protein